ncbi:MAG: HlyD family efflux transporter periplasmic adaptor subunit [Treponema sp.]|nr:HlyD family efflux transporter periplasmic adaptor subunit [Treponema sp.]
MAKKKALKIVIIIVVACAVIAGGLIGLRAFLSRSTDENVVYRVNKERYENIIEISGTVAAAQEQTLQALSDGTVVGVYVKAGDHVKKGDVILLLDDTTQQYNLAKHDYDMATTRITGSARELKLMETQRLALVQKIEDRKVVATFDGVIADLDVAYGDSLEAKDSVGTLVNIDYLTAEVEVAETDVAKLEKGQKVELKFSADESQTVYGYVESWPTIGEITSRGATIVKVKIRIDEYPSIILPNFSFTGKIQLEEPVDNIVVERYAIGYEDKKPYVVLAKTGEKVFVKVMPYGKENVKILEGLSGGELLLQQTKPSKSGQKKTQNSKTGNNMPGGMGGMGAGGFGPPPM